MLPGEGAQNLHGAEVAEAVVVAAAAGMGVEAEAAAGGGDVLGQRDVPWLGPQQEGRGRGGHYCWPRGGCREEVGADPGSTPPGMEEKAVYTWEADWRPIGL